MKKSPYSDGRGKGVDKVAGLVVAGITKLQMFFAESMSRLFGRLPAIYLKWLTVVFTIGLTGLSGYFIYGAIFYKYYNRAIPSLERSALPRIPRDEINGMRGLDSATLVKLRHYEDILKKKVPVAEKDSIPVSDREVGAWLDSLRRLQEMILSNSN